jgi:hypothetical protein
MKDSAMVFSRSYRIGLLLMMGLMLASAAALADAADGEPRFSITTQSTRAQRDNGMQGSVSQDEFAALVKSGKRTAASQRARQSKPGGNAAASSPNVDFWFYTADVILFGDHDNDGYFQGIDLLFDADTYYSEADVYAVVYLSFEGGPWNEYAATDNFTIFGATSDDEFVIVTELMSGYPSGSYDILIELFDAWDDSYLAYFGPDDTSELAFLPLEDATRNAPRGPGVVVVDHGGGALSWMTMLLLVAAASVRRRRQR